MKNSEVKKVIAELEMHQVNCKEFNKVYFADMQDAELSKDADFVADCELCINLSCDSIESAEKALRAAKILSKLTSKIKKLALWCATIDVTQLDELKRRADKVEKILYKLLDSANWNYRKFKNLAYDCFFYEVPGEKYFLEASLKDYTCI